METNFLLRNVLKVYDSSFIKEGSKMYFQIMKEYIIIPWVAIT